MPLTNKVKELRIKNRLTQAQLGSAVNVSRQTIIAIERGNYEPSLSLAIKLARFFRLPVEKLFSLK